MSKPHEYACNSCGAKWIGVGPQCPNGCGSTSKSGGEFTRKSFQGSDDTDLKKSGR